MTRPALVKRWLGSVAVITVALAWLHRLGAGDLAAPPLSIDGATSWLDHRDTAVAAFALLRVLAIAFGWYLLLVTAIGGASRYLQLPRMTSVLERLTVPFARGLLGGSLALLGVMAAPPAPTHAPDAMVELSADEPSTTVEPAPTVTEQATLHLITDVANPATTLPAATEPPPTATLPVTDPQRTWIVQPGESFWSIASEHLSDINGRAVTEREVDPYWRQVIEVNRSRLVNPNDADLLFTGQVLELPAVAPG